jgi:hypothetical protein
MKYLHILLRRPKTSPDILFPCLKICISNPKSRPPSKWRSKHRVCTSSDIAMAAYNDLAKVNGMSAQGSMQSSAQGTITTTKTITTNGTSTKSSAMMSSTYHQPNAQAVNVLREIISKVNASSKRSLSTSSAEVFEGSKDIGIVLDFIAGERLRCYPHPGSRYDKTLRWAESFATQFYAFSETVSDFVMHSSEAVSMIFGSCMLLLQVSFSIEPFQQRRRC